ncbi:SDR family oxidoreductase [Oryzihumus sp.]
MQSVLLITGGSRGIGAATALLAASRGFAVCVNYLQSQKKAKSLVSTLQAQGANAISVQADVSGEADVMRLFTTIDQQLGRVTALVNNAGTLSQQSRLDAMDGARLHRVFGLNVTGAFLCAREAVRRMSTLHGGAGGAIVNVSSGASRYGSPGEYIDYAASKAAIDAMTIGLAREVAGEGIRVVGVSPGLIDTGIHAPGRLDRLGHTPPLGRPGTPAEVADAIAWLVSDEASYVTGSTLDISGGR